VYGSVLHYSTVGSRGWRKMDCTAYSVLQDYGIRKSRRPFFKGERSP
jgi:hypothetical protein